MANERAWRTIPESEKVRHSVERKTICRWKWHAPLFYNTLDEAQRQSWNEAYRLLRSSILQSAQKLNHIIKKGRPQDAIKAAKVLLSTPVLTRLEGWSNQKIDSSTRVTH